MCDVIFSASLEFYIRMSSRLLLSTSFSMWTSTVLESICVCRFRINCTGSRRILWSLVSSDRRVGLALASRFGTYDGGDASGGDSCDGCDGDSTCMKLCHSRPKQVEADKRA